MNKKAVTLTLIDGPTLLIEIGGLRLLTDPTFDEPQAFTSGGATERKFNSPPVSAELLLPIDAVLLSHDQHLDNLDPAGRAFLPKAGKVISTVGAAERLGGNTLGLAPWSSTEVPLKDGRTLAITAVPARHGPVGIEAVTGHVTGFVLSIKGLKDIYVSGDTVWFSGLAEIAHRFDVGLAVLFAGAAQPRGPFNVTMDSNDAIEAATVFADAKIAAVHNFGWSHYTQSQDDLVRAFEVVGIGNRIEKLKPAVPVSVEI
jgi:L-ascorbate metabolism protein UlaG (beta-lactamase superfamily)